MVAASETLVRRLRAGLVLPLLALLVMPVERCVTWSNVKGPFKNNFRFWRERRRARCEARGGSIPHSGAVTDEQRSRWPDAAPPLGAGALWLAGFVAHSSQTAVRYARRSRLASKPNSLQQNRNLFLNEPLALNRYQASRRPSRRSRRRDGLCARACALAGQAGRLPYVAGTSKQTGVRRDAN